MAPCHMAYDRNRGSKMFINRMLVVPWPVHRPVGRGGRPRQCTRTCSVMRIECA